MKPIVTFSLLLTLLTLPACHSRDKSALQGVDTGKAESLNAQHSSFDDAREPAFSANTRFAAGQLAETHGSPARAIEQYEQAVKLDPHHRESLYRLGVLYAQTRQYPQAIDAWKEYINATDGDATGYSNLGYCHELAGNLPAAEAAYKEGIEKDPANKPCHINFGVMLARHNRLDEALAQLQSVLPPAHAHYKLASIHEQQGHKDQARAEYKKALELDPTLRAAQSHLSALQ